MTSNPASRSARATTFAPRSWPSRPGLATSTLSFLLMYILRAVHQQFRSERRRLFIGPKDLRHRRADLAERTASAGGVALLAQVVQPAMLFLLNRIVNLEQRYLDSLTLEFVFVHADHDPFL